MIDQIYSSLVYLGNITFYSEAFWIILPLFLSTILMVIYFGIYKEERTEWDSHFSNSFVLIFVSIALLRYIYGLDGNGILNYPIHLDKFLATILLLFVGYTLLKFNLEHLLPKKISRYVSSPLTVNLFAYAIVLFIYSDLPFSWHYFVALFIVIAFLVGFLLLLRFPSRRISEYLAREKEKERLQNVKERTFRISELKEELKFQKKDLNNLKSSEIEKKKKEISKLNKILRKNRS